MESNTAPKLYAAFDAEGNPFHIRGEGQDVTGMDALPSGMTVDQAAVLRRLPDGTWGPRLPPPEPTEEDRARDAANDLAARQAARLQAIEDEMAPYIEDNKIGIVTALQLSKKRAAVEARYPLITE
jgi:hypothetical protein